MRRTFLSARDRNPEHLFNQLDEIFERLKRIETFSRTGQSGLSILDHFISDVSNPPTDAELDSALGTPAEVGEGYAAIIDDGGAGANVWLVVSDGSNWWYEALTQAV